MTYRNAYQKYTFRDTTGYILAPGLASGTYPPVVIRHSASVSPWMDSDIHFHSESEEYYILIQGQIHLLVNSSLYKLKPGELLAVRPRVPHAVVGGEGPIEHFVLRMPAHDDRYVTSTALLALPPAISEAKRDFQSEWGVRVPLTDELYQNCWLFGVGQARFHSDQMCLAYLNFPTAESADAGRRSHPHRMHLHQESWEIYTLLKGGKVLQVEDQLVDIQAGELLVIPPGVRHVLQRNVTPCEGFTFRVPLLDDKVEC